jgi:hypothetical protein
MKTPLIELIRESVWYCDIDYDCVAHATRNETISETYKDKTAWLLHILFWEYLQFDEEIDRSQAEEIKEESNYKAPNGHCVDDMIYERASQQKDIYWSDLYDSCGAFGWYINELLSEWYGTHKNIQLTDLIQCGQTRFYEWLWFQAWSKFCEIYNWYLSSYSY